MAPRAHDIACVTAWQSTPAVAGTATTATTAPITSVAFVASVVSTTDDNAFSRAGPQIVRDAK